MPRDPVEHPSTAADRNRGAAEPALFSLGFRPFFLGAPILAIVAMALWVGLWRFGIPLEFSVLPSALWHAHELIYGYAMAVIAGFLLTAVRNWTGIQTLAGSKLCALFACWAAARVALFFGDAYLLVAACFDTAFTIGLVVGVGRPIVNARQWRQTAILSKLVLLGAANLLFYVGALAHPQEAARWGVYAGLYLVIGLILTVGRRVIPGFIERGAGYPVELVNRRWLDLSSMVLFVPFFILDTFTQHRRAAGWLACALFVLHCIRAAGWHTPGIWRKPLLWSLYCAYLFIISGFGLYALSELSDFSTHLLAVHAFTVGGIGLITVSMMGRVSLGHTGRDVHAPPRLLGWALALIALAFVVRVIFPMADAQHYLLWLLLSALAWVLGFAVFLVIFMPVLFAPRIDGRPG